MSCNTCNKNSLPRGCRGNGKCYSDGCDKLPVYDWLSDMEMPNPENRFSFVEVSFKNDRKGFFKNINNMNLKLNSLVCVEVNGKGYDIGRITLKGELVRIQMMKKKMYPIQNYKIIYRQANDCEIKKLYELRKKESNIINLAREVAYNYKLDMKISDVEYQGDGLKLTFYYTSDTRIDFRELIKKYASIFLCRIEMKQIGYRQESAKVGGIGSCGRELCCSTWLTNFSSVSTGSARYQQLSINSQKLAGQCGKLKCCINFELDAYLDALKDIPPIDTIFSTIKGDAYCVKVDVFRKEMWFAYKKGSFIWYKFSVNMVNKFIILNSRGIKTESLEELSKKNNQNYDIIKQEAIDRISTSLYNNKNMVYGKKKFIQKNR